MTQAQHAILFVGSEFSYRCLQCKATHCFLENVFWDFTDNFKKHGCGIYKWQLNRYAGTFTGTRWVGDSLLPASRVSDYVNHRTLETRAFFEAALAEPAVRNARAINVVPLSSKKKYESSYVANAISTSHFQDSLRAVVRMKEHLMTPKASDSYNVLIADQRVQHLLNPASKMQGLDAIWYVDWTVKATWDYGHKHLDDLQPALEVAAAVNKHLQKISKPAYVISKCCFPSPAGCSFIKELFQPNGLSLQLDTVENVKLQGKYVAVLVHKDSDERAGFATAQQLKDVCNTVRQANLKPLIVACTSAEAVIAKEVLDEEVLLAETLEKQSLFYSRFCVGVVGSNCSGCNLPVLFEVPVFAVAKKRFFPDDFYCMGRLLADYDCAAAFFGELKKPNNVTEVRIDCQFPTSILAVKDSFQLWLKQLNGAFDNAATGLPKLA